MSLNDTAKTTIDALKNQPVLLVIVLLNVLMLVMIGYSIRTAQANNHAVLQQMIEKCFGVKP